MKQPKWTLRQSSSPKSLFKHQQKFVKDLYLKKLVAKTLSESSEPVKCLCLPQ